MIARSRVSLFEKFYVAHSGKGTVKSSELQRIRENGTDALSPIGEHFLMAHDGFRGGESKPRITRPDRGATGFPSATTLQSIMSLSDLLGHWP